MARTWAIKQGSRLDGEPVRRETAPLKRGAVSAMRPPGVRATMRTREHTPAVRMDRAVQTTPGRGTPIVVTSAFVPAVFRGAYGAATIRPNARAASINRAMVRATARKALRSAVLKVVLNPTVMT